MLEPVAGAVASAARPVTQRLARRRRLRRRRRTRTTPARARSTELRRRPGRPGERPGPARHDPGPAATSRPPAHASRRLARVVSGPASNFENTIRIDQGTDAGVAVGMTVVTDAGLVGRVKRGHPRPLGGRAGRHPGLRRRRPAGGRQRPGDVPGPGPGAGQPAGDRGETSTRLGMHDGAALVTSGLDRALYPPDILVGPGRPAPAGAATPPAAAPTGHGAGRRRWRRCRRGGRAVRGPAVVVLRHRAAVAAAELTRSARRVPRACDAAVRVIAPGRRAGAGAGGGGLHSCDVDRRRRRPAAADLGRLPGWRAGPDRGAVVGFFAGLGYDVFLQTPFGLSALVYCVGGLRRRPVPAATGHPPTLVAGGQRHGGQRRGRRAVGRRGAGARPGPGPGRCRLAVWRCRRG